MIKVIEHFECDGCEKIYTKGFLAWVGCTMPIPSDPAGWLSIEYRLYCEECRKPVDKAISKLRRKSTPVEG